MSDAAKGRETRRPENFGACCRCSSKKNPDDSPVTWKCQGCGGFVCQNCTLRSRINPQQYLDDTLCSMDCFIVKSVEDSFMGLQPSDEQPAEASAIIERIERRVVVVAATLRMALEEAQVGHQGMKPDLDKLLKRINLEMRKVGYRLRPRRSAFPPK